MSVYDEMSESQQFACRVIADHARATAFAIADGILPGNEGRNYVLRKIMRRAIYHGREHLGLTEPFFYKVCDVVVDKMHGAYPELETQRDFIGKMVRLEEERFGNTLTLGLKRLNEILAKLETHGDVTSSVSDYPGAEFAELYDTYGVPIDLIYVAYTEHLKTHIPGFSITDSEVAFRDSEDFATDIQNQIKKLQESSTIGKTKQADKINPIYVALERTSIRSNFHGYETTKLDDAEVIALVKEDKRVEQLSEGDEGLIVLKDTPFYAESGGQVGDTGILVSAGSPPYEGGVAAASSAADGVVLSSTNTQDVDTNAKNHPVGETPTPLLRKEGSFRATVSDTYSPVAGLIIHKVTVDKGSLKVGDSVTATVDVEKRDATRRNHTATHLVHAALKEVLGSHVKQAGSVVAPNYLRFDFTHYQPMTTGEIAEVEDLVNRYIIKNEPVTTDMMKLEDAMRSGAVAMFGEKYGGEVRVLSVGDGAFSKELCGGTHVRATGDIGSFKITSDEAIASGVRRIRAITGFDAFERFRDDERLIDASLGALNTQRDNLPNAIAKLAEELKKTRKEIDELKLKIAMGEQGAVSGEQNETREIAGVKVLAKVVDGLDANGQRQLSDTLLARLKSGVVILGRSDEGKVSIIVRVSDDLTDRVKAGNVIKEIVPIVGGKGGGRADMAEGGGTEPDKLGDAIDASYRVIEQMLG